MDKEKDTTTDYLKMAESFINNNQLLQEKDSVAFRALSTLIIGYPYLPVTPMSMDYHSLAVLINDIVINRRTSVLEFGCGISTLFIARLIKHNQLNCRLLSVESDFEWFQMIKEDLTKEGLHTYVDLIYAPLEKMPSNVNGHNTPWYSFSCLLNAIENKLFDMAIVDGPPANSPEIIHSRYPALDFILSHKKIRKTSACFYMTFTVKEKKTL